jgi:hypothetical protein
MIPRPRFTLPIWAALAIAGAAYLIRSYLWKAGDLRPEMPQDAIALVAFATGIAFVTWARSRNPGDGSGDE